MKKWCTSTLLSKAWRWRWETTFYKLKQNLFEGLCKVFRFQTVIEMITENNEVKKKPWPHSCIMRSWLSLKSVINANNGGYTNEHSLLHISSRFSTFSFFFKNPFHSLSFVPLWLSRGHLQWKCSGDTAGCSLCVCACLGVAFGRGCNWGRNRGNGSNEGEGGPEGRSGEQTDAAQTPEGLRSHIFLASSPGDRDMWEHPRAWPQTHKNALSHVHTHRETHTHAHTQCF